MLLNMTFVWGSVAFMSGKLLNYFSSADHIDLSKFRIRDLKDLPPNLARTTFFAQAFMIDPLCLFFYCWSFLPTLNNNLEVTWARNTFKFLIYLTIALVPPAYLSIFIALMFEYEIAYQYALSGKIIEF